MLIRSYLCYLVVVWVSSVLCFRILVRAELVFQLVVRGLVITPWIDCWHLLLARLVWARRLMVRGSCASPVNWVLVSHSDLSLSRISPGFWLSLAGFGALSSLEFKFPVGLDLLLVLGLLQQLVPRSYSVIWVFFKKNFWGFKSHLALLADCVTSSTCIIFHSLFDNDIKY